MIEIRKKEGIAQKIIEERGRVKQPVIDRMKSGATEPQLTTVLKVLSAFDQALKIVDIEPSYVDANGFSPRCSTCVEANGLTFSVGAVNERCTTLSFELQ